MEEEIEDKGYIDPTKVPPPKSNMNSLLEEMVFNKEVTLQHQCNHCGVFTIKLSKRYKGYTDVAKTTFNTGEADAGKYKELDDLLRWLAAVLRKFNKKEI